MDCFLPFCIHTSPFLFDIFAKLSWAIFSRYLDDFLAVLPPHVDAELYGRDFDNTCDDLGFIVCVKKKVTGTAVDFLGIKIDSVAIEAHLPQDKLQRAKRSVQMMFLRDTTKHAKLESLAGFLPFAAKFITPGRAFLQRLYDALSKKTTYINFNADIKANLAWWKKFFANWNSIRLLCRLTLRSLLYIRTDVSGNCGLGGFILLNPPTIANGKEAFSIPLTTRWRSKGIQFKEMLAAHLALRRWRHQLADAKVIFYCNNQAVIAGSAHSSIRGQAMGPLRDLFLLLVIILKPQ